MREQNEYSLQSDHLLHNSLCPDHEKRILASFAIERGIRDIIYAQVGLMEHVPKNKLEAMATIWMTVLTHPSATPSSFGWLYSWHQ
jgi:hypothetical protein